MPQLVPCIYLLQSLVYPRRIDETGVYLKEDFIKDILYSSLLLEHVLVTYRNATILYVSLIYAHYVSHIVLCVHV